AGRRLQALVHRVARGRTGGVRRRAGEGVDMRSLSGFEIAMFLMESNARPMHAVAVMLFDPPADEKPGETVERTVAAFREAKPVAPWNLRPVLGLGSVPHLETVDEIDMDYHVRHLALAGPGSLP